MIRIPGYAVQEVFFTSREEDVYAILPKLPESKLVLKDIQVSRENHITLLGSDRKIQWEQKGKDLLLTFPVFSVNEFFVTMPALKLEKVK